MEALWVVLALGVAAIVVAWALLRKAHRRGEKRELRSQVQTWEDEGGNVPDVPTPGAGTSRQH